jgi:hypothetical protein
MNNRAGDIDKKNFSTFKCYLNIQTEFHYLLKWESP